MKKNFSVRFLLAVLLISSSVLLNGQTPFTITWTGLGGAGTTNATGVPTGITIVQQYNGVTPGCVSTPSNGATTSYTAVIQAATGYNVTITSIGGSAYGSSAGSKLFTLRLTNGAAYTQTNPTTIGTSSSCSGNTPLNVFSIPVAGQTLSSGNSATITVLRGIAGSESGGGYSYTRTLTISGTVTPVSACTAPTLSTIVTNTSCNGGSNGTINLTASGGSTPYTGFSWNGPSGFSAASEDISSRPAGTYTVTVTATGGCTASATAVIGQPPAISRSATFAPPTCNGGTNGSVNLTASGGTGTLNFLWSNSATSEDLSNIPAGSYSVTVTDANSCTATASVTVTQPAAVSLNAVPTNITCNGNNDGSIDLTVTNGVGTIDYVWSNTDITEDISGLSQGTYDVTVTDDNGCTGSTSVSINEPAAITLNAAVTDLSCNGGNNGAIDLTATGGTGSLDFNWSNSSTSEDLSGLTSGNYSVTVTDVNGCTSTASATINQPAAIVLSTIVTNENCNGGTNGAIDLTATGGTGSLDFSWDNSAATEDLSGVSAGAYEVTVTDANGCSNTAMATITEPSAITLNAVVTDITCNSGNTGSIDLTATGGTGALDFSWSNSVTTEDLSGLTAGTYDVTVTDANGCTNSASVTVNEPTGITLTIVSSDVLCNGGNDGSVDLTATGGTGTLDFSWSNNATTEDLSGVTAGTYDVTVTDDNGCTNTESIIINEPAALNLNTVSTDISCNGLTDGSIDLTVTGGTGSMDFNWSNTGMTEDISGLSAGTYNVTVTDANGCTDSISANINEPAALNTNVVATDISCNGLTDGSIDLTVTGGTGSMDFNWSNAEITEDISGLSAGTYQVSITDANGCTNSASGTIAEPPGIVLSASSTGILCNGESNGSIDLTASGGTGSLDFSWTNTEITEDISGLPAGTYGVTVTDNNGCTNTTSVVLTEPNAITSAINASSCADYISPSGLYIWSATGIYTDTLAAVNGCDSVITVNLTVNTPDVSAMVNDHTFTAIATGVTYQWVNCSDNFSVVSGATSQTYTSPVNGTFAVIINKAGCVDTSACFTTFNTSISENELNGEVKLYPNPNHGIFNLSVDGLTASDLKVVITDITGKQVYQYIMGAVNSPVNQTMEISSLKAGIYLLSLHADGKIKTIRFMVN